MASSGPASARASASAQPAAPVTAPAPASKASAGSTASRPSTAASSRAASSRFIAPAMSASAPDATGIAVNLRAQVLQALPWLLAFWLLVSLWHGLRLVFSAFALRRLRAAALLLEAQDWQDDAAELARGFAVSAPELKISPAIGSPLATPGGSILLPVWALSLSRDQRRAVLAHELAHLRRRDPHWRAVLALWRALLWPLPLAALAQQRLEALAELECDAAAARALGDGRPLAECLAQCLEQHLDRRFPAFAAAMAAPRSPLLQRAEQLLEGVPMSPFTIPRGLRLAVLAGVIAAALALPAFVVPVSAAAERVAARSAGDESGDCNAVAGNCVSIHGKNDVMSVRWSLPGRRVTYQASGAVRFNPQETALESLAAGATASIEEVVDTTSRKVEYRNGAKGLEATFYLDGKPQPLDAQAEAWLARLLPQLLREAAIDVPARIARLQQRGGNKAVLDEIALIKSDHARGRYLAELLGRHALSAGELDLALAQADRIGSDYEKRQVLSAALDSQQVATAQLVKVLQSGAGIGSDYERAQLLMQAADRVGGDATLRAAWLRSLDGLGSDFERRRALDALLGKSEDTAALLQILAAGDAIGSDFEHRELLVHVAARTKDAEAIAAGYARAAASIGSDFERREALLALLRSGGLRRDGALAVLDAAAGIGSDFECRTVLVELARVMPDDAQVRQRLVDVASRLSDFEREQVEQAAGLVRG
nr:M56 family metallopeptidase [Tahibacter harae]